MKCARLHGRALLSTRTGKFNPNRSIHSIRAYSTGTSGQEIKDSRYDDGYCSSGGGAQWWCGRWCGGVVSGVVVFDGGGGRWYGGVRWRWWSAVEVVEVVMVAGDGVATVGFSGGGERQPVMVME
ncbi:hypothetical protein Tco_0606032 [Tanacetum coccineum]